LRGRVGTIEEKSYDFLKELFADVHGAVDAIGGLDPIHFANRNLPGLSFSAIAELDVEQVSAQYYGHAVKGIAVPGGGLAGGQALAADKVISAMMQNLLILCQVHIHSPGGDNIR